MARAQAGGRCGFCGRELCFLQAEDGEVGPAAEGGAEGGGSLEEEVGGKKVVIWWEGEGRKGARPLMFQM